MDNDKDGRIRCVIHELLHVVFHDKLAFLCADDLEELFILGLEKGLDEYVNKSQRRLDSWRKAIEEKLIATLDEDTEND